MTYVVQEYTSPLDGKVRFRVVSPTRRGRLLTEWGALGMSFMVGGFHGDHDGVDYDTAKRLADGARLERRLFGR